MGNPMEVMNRGEDILENRMSDAAIDAGIDPSILPKAGTEAYSRLYKVAKAYSDEVQREMMGREFPDSQSERRRLHSELCVMLFGKTWEDAGQENVKKARNFAHLLSGRDHLTD
jgi:hypothetical protein